jgi:ribonuclease HI
MPDSPASPLPSVTIYTDGGADPNPGPGGWGAVLVHPETGRREELSGAEPRTTNNRMELTAAIRALAALRRRCRVDLHTDSQYLRRGITEWLPGWIARGWRRKDGELQNEDLWRQLAAEVSRHAMSWKWVKGHAGHAGNERADQLATAAMRAQRAQRAQQTSAGGARPASPAAGRPEIEVFLRVSCSKQGAGWAALIRPAAGVPPDPPSGRFGGLAVSGGSGGAPVAPAAAGAPASAGPPAALSAGDPAASSAGDPAAAPAGERNGERLLRGALPAGVPATSNALDLVAALGVIEVVPAGTAVAVHTASDYLRLGASRWLEGWRRRGWKTQEGKPVLNRELWQRLAAALAARRVSWPEVKDREVEELERLGPLARAAAQGAKA